MFNKSLSNILSSFTKVSDELTVFMNRTSTVITQKEETINVLRDEVVSLDHDFLKAEKVRDKIKELIGD